MENILALGQEVSEAFLYTPGESTDLAKDHIKQRMAMKAVCFNVSLSEPTFEDVTPDDLRIKEFVEGQGWPDGTRCVIGYSMVTVMHGIFKRPESAGAEWLADLAEQDLLMMRAVTRKVAVMYGEELTDQQCDDIIAERGPDIYQNVIKKAVKGG
jgi:hypothetical protein